ncbi:MAG: septum formation initiator family protein [Syntrophales bacterium LBB04]|nr:septum formation initiator family protein [Syntrophales bacterium LBB04]
MKVGRYLVGFVIFMGLLITFGNRGLVDSYTMKERLGVLKAANQEIAEQNRQLKKTISLLRNDLTYVEMVARNELGMVNEGDLVYRFTK